MKKVNLEDITAEKVLAELGYDGVAEVDKHQRSTDLSKIDWSMAVDSQIFSRELEEKFSREKLLGLLANNTTYYEDDVEEAIDDDQLITELTERKIADRVNEDRYALALRARRTIVAAMFEHDIEMIEVRSDDLTGNSENNHPTAA